jgi:hypothetical protein
LSQRQLLLRSCEGIQPPAHQPASPSDSSLVAFDLNHVPNALFRACWAVSILAHLPTLDLAAIGHFQQPFNTTALEDRLYLLLQCLLIIPLSPASTWRRCQSLQGLLCPLQELRQSPSGTSSVGWRIDHQQSFVPHQRLALHPSRLRTSRIPSPTVVYSFCINIAFCHSDRSLPYSRSLRTK